MTEIELAKEVITYLENDGWDVYQEVPIGRGGEKVADIVAKRGRVIWIIETKTSFTVDVISQAYWWHNHAHFVSVAVASMSDNKVGKFKKDICQTYGIGVIVWEQTKLYSCIKEHVRPKLNRHALTTIDKYLTPDMKTFCPAGAQSDRHRLTPFRITVRELISIVSAQPGIALKDAINLLKKSHYASRQSAVASIKELIDNGTIKELALQKDGRKLLVFLSGIEWNPEECFRVKGKHLWTISYSGLERYIHCEYCHHKYPGCEACTYQKEDGRGRHRCPPDCPVRNQLAV